jgi:hypothetical protein
MANLEIYKKPKGIEKYSSPESFINLSPKAANIDLRHIKTENDILVSVKNSETPSIARIKKHHGEESTISFIALWIADLNISLNIKNTMGVDQIEECAFFILDDYYYLTMADFKLFFTGIKKGKYGKTYESLSMAKILEWLESYVINRTSMFENSEPAEVNEIRERKKIDTGGSIKELTDGLNIRKQLDKSRRK